MCGRYVLTATKSTLAQQFTLDLGTLVMELPERYNIAPTQQVLAIRTNSDGSRSGDMLSWGLVPSWASDRSIGSRMINARAETLHEKPAFRSAFKRRRCLIPASGFYEWRKAGKWREPFFIRPRDDSPVAFGGLWESWRDPDSGSVFSSCAIVTVEANDLIRPLHDRMPLILDQLDYDEWLDDDIDNTRHLQSLLLPYASEAMTLYPVVPLVNRVGAEGAELLTPTSHCDASLARAQVTLDL